MLPNFLLLMVQPAILNYEVGNPTNHLDGIEQDHNFLFETIGMATLRILFWPLLETFIFDQAL